jgi:hypothetical protein
MLGLERHVPDETQVVVRPPLTLPPDYELMPPGTPSTVSADHEGAQSMTDAGLAPVPPKKEEPGFFGRLFNGDMFGFNAEPETPKVPEGPKPADSAASPAPDAKASGSAAPATP